MSVAFHDAALLQLIEYRGRQKPELVKINEQIAHVERKMKTQTESKAKASKAYSKQVGRVTDAYSSIKH
jgi:hypothetical protein